MSDKTLTGDVQMTPRVPGVVFDADIYVDMDGRLTDSAEEGARKIINANNYFDLVLRVVDGTLDDVAHLIGYTTQDIAKFIPEDDKTLRVSEEVNAHVKALHKRESNAFLIVENDVLTGVIVDEQGQVQRCGVVKYVTPSEYNNCVRMESEETWQFVHGMNDDTSVEMLSRGSHLGMICMLGFTFVQLEDQNGEIETTKSRSLELHDSLPELALILERGYFLLDAKYQVQYANKTREWRPQLQDYEMVYERKTLEFGEYMVSDSAAVLIKAIPGAEQEQARVNNREPAEFCFEVIGGFTALSSEAFSNVYQSMSATDDYHTRRAEEGRELAEGDEIFREFVRFNRDGIIRCKTPGDYHMSASVNGDENEESPQEDNVLGIWQS